MYTPHCVFNTYFDLSKAYVSPFTYGSVATGRALAAGGKEKIRGSSNVLPHSAPTPMCTHYSSIIWDTRNG